MYSSRRLIYSSTASGLDRFNTASSPVFWWKFDGRIGNIGQHLQDLGICTFFPNTARWDIADCSVSTSFKAKYRVTIWLDDWKSIYLQKWNLLFRSNETSFFSIYTPHHAHHMQFCHCCSARLDSATSTYRQTLESCWLTHHQPSDSQKQLYKLWK